MRSRIAIALAALLAGCDFEAPLLEGQPPIGNVVSGTLVANGVAVPGDTIVLVYAANDPGPPAGTGSPVTLATVPAAAYTGEGAGLQAAPFAVTGLDDGTYILQALMDLDGDFNPFDISVSGATCGDVAGAHVTDLVTGTIATVTVQGGQNLDDVTIALGTVVPLERPAFALPAPQVVSREASLNPTTPQTFTLASTAVHSAFGLDFPLDLPGPCAVNAAAPQFCDPTQLDLCDTAFWVHVVDAGQDGLPDPRPDLPPEAGIPDIWPRVYLQYLGLPNADGTGFEPLPEGESWSAEAFPFLAEIGAWAQGILPAPPVPVGAVVPMPGISVTWAPVAKHVHPGGQAIDPVSGEHYDIVDLRQGSPLDAVPPGAWSITVVAETGQTWRIPNALAVVGVTTQPDAFDPASQAGVLVVQ
ncbi:MAG: hypothetical protein H6737_11380 [Alphaproteobacteria bacterium]|nr:hypothetical protein [Alphaproteobacteria bacterium]